MKFLCLAYGDETKWNALSKSKQDALLAHDKLLRVNGHLVAEVNSATTVRFLDGKEITSVGPLAQTKEELAGFYIIEAKDLKEVLRLVSKTPCAQVGAFEVHPIEEIKT